MVYFFLGNKQGFKVSEVKRKKRQAETFVKFSLFVAPAQAGA